MHVWYAGYGSNLERSRFLHYVRGGCPPGARRVLPGCRDRTPPTEARALTLPGAVFFAWESPTWGGGIAFYDGEGLHAGDGPALARAYRITAAQFADVAAQEMHRRPGADLDLTDVLAHGRHELGPGRYETLHLVGELAGEPVLTFSTNRPSGLTPNPPAPAYLRTMLSGLIDAHGLSPMQAADYLAARPGVGSWTAERIAALTGGTGG